MIKFLIGFVLGLSASSLNIQSAEINQNSYIDSEIDALDSAIGVINGAINDEEKNIDYAKNRYRMNILDWFFPTAYAANTCDNNRYVPSLGTITCEGTLNNRTVLINYNNCSPNGHNYITLSGTNVLSFDSTETCSDWIANPTLPTVGSVNRSYNDFTKNVSRLEITSNANNHTNYLGSPLGGGILTIYNLGSREINITGVKREGTFNTAVGNRIKVFDHTISSPTPLIVLGNKSDDNRVIQSGIVQVDHNSKLYTLIADLNNLTYSSSCCFPTSGTISMELFGSKNGTIDVVFRQNCGQVEITQNGQTVFQTLTGCE